MIDACSGHTRQKTGKDTVSSERVDVSLDDMRRGLTLQHRCRAFFDSAAPYGSVQAGTVQGKERCIDGRVNDYDH